MELAKHKERYQKWHGLLEQKSEAEISDIAHSLIGILQAVSELPNVDEVVRNVIVDQVEEVLEEND